MLKKHEIEHPASCLNKARPHEMIFVLLARDAAAPEAIRAWVAERLKRGLNKPEDSQISEALKCASRMDEKYHCPECQWSGPLAKAMRFLDEPPQCPVCK